MEEREQQISIIKKLKSQVEKKETQLNIIKTKYQQTAKDLDVYRSTTDTMSGDTKLRKLQKDFVALQRELKESIDLINELKTSIYQTAQSIYSQIQDFSDKYSNNTVNNNNNAPTDQVNYYSLLIFNYIIVLCRRISRYYESINTNKR